MYATPSAVLLLLSLSLPPDATWPVDDHGDPLPKGALGRLGTVRLRAESGGRCAFSPDGKLLVRACRDRAVVWDVATGRREMDLPVERPLCLVAIFSPDGSEVAVGGEDKTVRIFDSRTGTERLTLRGHDKKISALAFAPDGKSLASGACDELSLWDVATGKEVVGFSVTGHAFCSLAWSAHGKEIISAGHDGTLRAWDVRSWKERRVATTTAPINSVSLSPDGALVAHGDGILARVRDFASGKEVCALGGHDGEVTHVAFCPDGKTVATASADGTARLWHPTTGKQLWKIDGVPGSAPHLAWAPDGKTLAVTLREGVRLWDVEAKKEMRPRHGHQGHIHGLSFSPDGKVLASSGDDGVLQLWDFAEMLPRDRLPAPPGREPRVVFSPDGKRLACSASRIDMWDPSRPKEPLWSVAASSQTLSRIAFAPDGGTVAVGDWDDEIHILGTASGRQRQVLRGPSRAAAAVAYSPSGLLASGSAVLTNPVTRIWDPAAEEYLRIEGRESRVLAVTPDGTLLLSAPSVGAVHLYSMATGKLLHATSFDMDDWLGDMALSPDGRLFATVHTGGAVHVFELTTGQEVLRFDSGESRLFSAAFAPDGRTLATGGTGCVVALWDLAPRGWDRKATVRRAGQKELVRWWADLNGGDAAAAHRAVWSLAGAENGGAFLSERLRAEVTRQDIARLVADLDAPRFATREAASKKLAELGRSAEPALRKAQKETDSAEVTRRVEDLLAKLTTPEEAMPGREEVGRMRAVWALELSGTREARRLLETLAQETPDERLAREARAAADRLERH